MIGTASARCVITQVIGFPTLLFLLFLGWRLLPSIRKLQSSQSHIMTTYYAFLWVVGLLNVLRCCAYIAEVETSNPLLLNLLWLLTRFGLLGLACSTVPAHAWLEVCLGVMPAGVWGLQGW